MSTVTHVYFISLVVIFGCTKGVSIFVKFDITLERELTEALEWFFQRTGHQTTYLDIRMVEVVCKGKHCHRIVAVLWWLLTSRNPVETPRIQNKPMI